MLQIVIVLLAVAQGAYWAAAALLTIRHFRRSPRPASTGAPYVCVLKPVCGAEQGAYECFASFCQQDYKNYSLLFGVAGPDDPAIATIERLRQDFPDCDVQLHVGRCGGLNPKIRILQNLANRAEGEILVVSDADVHAPPDHLQQMVAPLSNPDVGVVNCPYLIRQPRTITDRLEALRLATEFLPAALIAGRLGVPVGLGAAMAMRAADVDQLGGFATFSDYLLEDNRMASRLTEGKSAVLLKRTVTLSPPGHSLRQCVGRELRWARGIRATGALRYLGCGITYSFPLLVLGAIAPSAMVWSVLGCLLVFRGVAAGAACRAQRGRMGFGAVLLLPVRDALSFGVWCCSLAGRRVHWRGHVFFLGEGGRISRGRPPRLLAELFRRSVRRLDAALRARERIFEFTDRPECVLRVRRVVAAGPVDLKDGTHISPGDPLCELHLWNEHVPTMGENGPDLQWSLRAGRAAATSFAELADAVRNDPRLEGVKGICAHSAFAGGNDVLERFFTRMGFEVRPDRGAATLMGKCHNFFENMLVWALNWTFNRHSLKGKPFLRPRTELWMSREVLLSRHLPRQTRTMSVVSQP